MKGPQVTLATMHYTDGTHTAFWIGRGRLRGPKGKRYFDWNAKDTVQVADVPLCCIPRTHGFIHYPLTNEPFGGLLGQLERQYATPDAPPVDWSL